MIGCSTKKYRKLSEKVLLKKEKETRVTRTNRTSNNWVLVKRGNACGNSGDNAGTISHTRIRCNFDIVIKTDKLVQEHVVSLAFQVHIVL